MRGLNLYLFTALKAPDQETLVYDLDSSTAILTSFDRRHQTDSRELELLCFSTTESVNWVDLRMPGKVVASIEHHRAFDRTLELLSSEICGRTFWSTRVLFIALHAKSRARVQNLSHS